MIAYTVHEPPSPPADRMDRAVELAFVREGFSWPAAIFGPLWLIAHGLWLALLGYVAVVMVLSGIMAALEVGETASTLVMLALNILLGFEGDSLRRWTLRRRGWRDLGVVTGRTGAECERRFFDKWLAEQPHIRPDALAGSGVVADGTARRLTSGTTSGGWRGLIGFGG